MNKENWMKDLDGAKPVSMMNIPGTHDSATQFMNSTMPKLYRCQDKSIIQQIKLGARFIDARLEYKNKHFRFVHSIGDCRSAKPWNSALLYFDDVLADIKLFLKTNPSETILLSVKMDDGKNSDVFYREFYNAYIKDNKELWHLENRIPHLDEVRGKIVLVRRCILGDSSFSSLNNGLDFSFWEDQSSCKSTLPLPCWLGNEKNEKAIIQDRFRLEKEAKWQKAAVTMFEDYEPQPNMMALNFLSAAGVPQKNAEYINAEFKKYKLPKKLLGVVIFDFIDSELATKIIDTNFEA